MLAWRLTRLVEGRLSFSIITFAGAVLQGERHSGKACASEWYRKGFHAVLGKKLFSTSTPGLGISLRSIYVLYLISSRCKEKATSILGDKVARLV